MIELYNAIYSNNVKAVKSILAVGDVEINEYCKELPLPLQAACEMGNLEMVEDLVKAGADVNAASYRTGNTALICACATANLKLPVSSAIVTYLISAGADVNKCCSGGTTPLAYAVRRNNYEAVKKLESAGALLAPAMSDVASYGRPSIITFILSKLHVEFDLESEREKILSECLIRAALSRNTRAAYLFIEAGADVNYRFYAAGVTPLTSAIYGGSIELVEKLILSKANVDLKEIGVDGLYPLEAAFQERRKDILELLLKSGANKCNFDILNVVSDYD